MIGQVLQRQPEVRALFDNGWLTLVSIDGETGLCRRYDRGAWIAGTSSLTSVALAA
jgi:hypothetical protein